MHTLVHTRTHTLKCALKKFPGKNQKNELSEDETSEDDKLVKKETRHSNIPLQGARKRKKYEHMLSAEDDRILEKAARHNLENNQYKLEVIAAGRDRKDLSPRDQVIFERYLENLQHQAAVIAAGRDGKHISPRDQVIFERYRQNVVFLSSKEEKRE
jgi:hypothetical protein